MKKQEKIKARDLKPPKLLYMYHRQEHGDYAHPQITVYHSTYTGGVTTWIGYSQLISLKWQQNRNENGQPGWTCPYGLHVGIESDGSDYLPRTLDLLKKISKQGLYGHGVGLKHVMRFLAKHKIRRYVDCDITADGGRTTHYVPVEYRDRAEDFAQAQRTVRE